MTDKQIRPNFIVIGPGKSGTTWLYHALRQHPEVFMADCKETMYFNEYYQKGLDWYLRFFAAGGDRRAVGEVTNTYIFSAEAAQRIAAFAPAMKIITILRNPVERTFSHYLFLLRNGEVQGSFDEVLRARPDLLERGRYAHLLRAYRQHFDTKQMGIFVFDDLRSDPQALYTQVCRFLGVDNTFEPQLHNDDRLPASYPRSRLVAKLVKDAALKVRELGKPEWVTRIKQLPWVRWLYKPYDKYPEMSDATRRELQAYFRDDVAELSQLVNRDLSYEWLGVSEYSDARQQA